MDYPFFLYLCGNQTLKPMQKLFLAVALFISLQSTAQTKLTLIFEKKTEVFDDSNSEKISQSPVSRYYLNLTKDVSEYFLVTEKTIDGVEKDYPSQYLYKNLEKHTYTWQRNEGEDFTYGELPEFKWELKPGSKKILGYTVRKAVLDSADKNITAWYSILTYKNGPEMYHGLPGLILEIEETKSVNGSTQKTVLTAISMDSSRNSRIIVNPLEQENQN